MLTKLLFGWHQSITFGIVIQSHLNQYRAIWNHREPSGAIWGHLEPPGTIWNMKPSRTIWNDLSPSGTICKYLEPSNAIWSSLGPSLVPSGTTVSRTISPCSANTIFKNL